MKRLTNEELSALQEQCEKSGALPVLPEVKPEKGKEKEAEQTQAAYRAATELYDLLRVTLPALIDELLSKRHKLNE